MTDDSGAGGWRPTQLPENYAATPNVARMYDYYLGGKDHWAVDREAAENVVEAVPEVATLARENRAFLARAVRFLAGECGIRQFVDIGAGLPTAENTHEIAQRVAPESRVVYVDNDPVTIAHARAILADKNDRVEAVDADMRDPAAILDASGTRRLIDFGQPVAVLLLLMLHFLSDEEDPGGIVARLRQAMAPGSYLVLCHGTADRHPEAMERIENLYQRAASPATLRPREQIRRFFEGFELADPGLVYISEWRPDDPDRAQQRAWAGLVGVGRKP